MAALHQCGNGQCIGVNRPAIVREIPHFGIFPAFPHFCENIPHFWLYFEMSQIAENYSNFHCRRHFVRKSSAKTSIIASPSYFLLKNTSISASHFCPNGHPPRSYSSRCWCGKCQVKASEMRRTSRIFFSPCWQLCQWYHRNRKTVDRCRHCWKSVQGCSQ